MSDFWHLSLFYFPIVLFSVKILMNQEIASPPLNCMAALFIYISIFQTMFRLFDCTFILTCRLVWFYGIIAYIVFAGVLCNNMQNYHCMISYLHNFLYLILFVYREKIINLWIILSIICNFKPNQLRKNILILCITYGIFTNPIKYIMLKTPCRKPSNCTY